MLLKYPRPEARLAVTAVTRKRDPSHQHRISGLLTILITVFASAEKLQITVCSLSQAASSPLYALPHSDRLAVAVRCTIDVCPLLSVSSRDVVATEKSPQWPKASLSQFEIAEEQSPWRGNWVLQRASHLESETQFASPRALRHSRRWVESRSHSLDKITLAIFPLHQSAPSRLSRKVRRWPPASLPERPTAVPWKVSSALSAQNLRCLATATVPKRLGGLRETSLRWPGIRAPVSGPLHPSRGHLQPSPGLVCRREGHLPLAGLRS